MVTPSCRTSGAGSAGRAYAKTIHDGTVFFSSWAWAKTIHDVTVVWGLRSKKIKKSIFAFLLPRPHCLLRNGSFFLLFS
jgi:hypothetical protein